MAIDAAISTFRTLLSENTDFWTWAGVANATQALERIVDGGYDESSDEPTRPFVVVDDGDNYEDVPVGVATSVVALTITLEAHRDISSENQADAQAAKAEMRQKWSDLRAVLNALRDAEPVGGGSRLAMGRITQAEKPQFFTLEASDDNQKPYEIWVGAVEIEMGPGAFE